MEIEESKESTDFRDFVQYVRRQIDLAASECVNANKVAEATGIRGNADAIEISNEESSDCDFDLKALFGADSDDGMPEETRVLDGASTSHAATKAQSRIRTNCETPSTAQVETLKRSVKGMTEVELMKLLLVKIEEERLFCSELDAMQEKIDRHNQILEEDSRKITALTETLRVLQKNDDIEIAKENSSTLSASQNLAPSER